TFETCDQYTLQGDLFSRAVRAGAPAPVPLEDAVANMAVLDALAPSAATGRWGAPAREPGAGAGPRRLPRLAGPGPHVASGLLSHRHGRRGTLCPGRPRARRGVAGAARAIDRRHEPRPVPLRGRGPCDQPRPLLARLRDRLRRVGDDGRGEAAVPDV